VHFAARHLSSAVVCISEAVRQHLLADQPKFGGRLVVVHDGLPLEDFFPVSDGSAIRQKLGVPASAPFVGMVGRLNHWKGQVVFVHAAKIVLDRFPGANFLVVGSVFGGDPHYLDVLHSELERAGISKSFRICDFRRDVPEIMSSLDVYVHPSLLPEPFGLVVIEAMAACRPVVATAHGGPLEIIEDGISGYLVPPGDAVALAGKIAACLEDPALSRTMGKRGQVRALQLFHVSRYIDGIQAVYDTILEARHAENLNGAAGCGPGQSAAQTDASGRRQCPEIGRNPRPGN
jgi:glycosyltransferase involved in cell wall biosynthesis